MKEIAAVFLTSIEDIQRKIDNLRNQVSQELQKLSKRKSGSGGSAAASKLPYLSALQFVVPAMTAKTTTSNLISDASEYYDNLSREDLLNHLMRERCLRHQLEQELKEREQFIQELQQRIKELRPKQQASAEVANTTVYTRCSKLMQTGIPDSQSLPNVQHTYNKSAGFADMSGEWYEIKMATLLFLRGLNYTEDFFLATNFDGAGIFDDVVFKYTFKSVLGEVKSRICFLQLKHKQRAVITYSKIFGPKGAFSLASYFKSYCEVKKTLTNNPAFEFCGDFEQFEFILYTNAESQLLPTPCDRKCCSKDGDIFSSSSESQVICENALRTIVDVMSKYKTFLLEVKRSLGNSNTCDSKEIIVNLVNSFIELSENKEVSEKLTKLKLKPCKDELEKLIKEIEPWGDLSKYSEFLGKFKMLTGQASETQLDYLIKQEIVKLFQTPELETDLIFADLKERMQNWWKDGSSNYYLTKSASLWLDLMKSRIMELSLPEWQMLKNLDIQYCQDQVHILSVDITENRVVNIFASGRSTKLTCLKVYQAMAAIQGDRYLFLSLGTSLARQGEVLSVWQSVWCDMLVVDCDPTSDNPKTLFDNFAKILQNNKHKKLIFITLPSDVKLSNSIRNIILDGYSEIHDMFKLTNLNLQSQAQLLDKVVSFQGFDVPLGDLIAQHLELKEAINTEIIYILLNKEKLIIGEALTDIVEYYVPRTLQRQHFLKKSVLKDSDSVSVFAISGTTKGKIQQLIFPHEKVFNCKDCKNYFPQGCRFFVLNKHSEKSDFEKLLEKFRVVHWLVDESDRFLWKQSQGDVATLRKYIMRENSSYDLERMLGLHDRTMLIVAEPGMGKSTFLTYVANHIKKRDPSCWVIKVTLNDYTCYLNTIKLEQLQDSALGFLELVANVNTQNNADLVKMLLKYSYLYTGKLVILLDGFDEVCPNYTNKVSKLLELFMASRIRRLWITSRPVMQTKLEEKLCSLPFTLKPFTEEDQINTLKMFWKRCITDGERTDTFINNLLHLTSQYLNDKDRHFTGIPLQTLLLAEVFENDLRVYQESKQFNFHEECDLFLLYDRFVEKKWDVYLSEKKKEDTSNIGVQRDNEDLKNIFMSNHMIAALLRILSPKDLSVLKYKDLQVKGSRFIGRVEQGYDHTGIILGITDGVPRFVHHTFAEYFTAKWFAMNFSENRNFVEHNFWESSYEVVKSIFDRILANDSDLHIAVLRNDVVAVTDLLEKGAEVNFRDLGGRSALHLAAVQKNGEDIIEILIKHGADIHLVDEVLQWTALRYADKVRAWSVIGVILQNKGNTNDLVFTKQTFCDGDYIISALHIAAKGGYIELLEFLLYTDKYINISLDNDRYSLLHVAAQYGQRGVLELLLAKGANILCKDKNENTPMHFASKNGHLGVVQCLVERMESKKFDKEYYRYINLVLEGINSKDKQGKTPLFIASEHNHLEVVKYLTEKGADVEICSRDGYSPLYIALLKGNTNVIYFLKDVATVDKGSKNGWTLMHTASTNGHLNVIEHLLKISANINACNKYGQTPLHITAKKNNVKVLQFLIQEGALVNVHDKTFGWTPLNYAIQEGYLDIVEHLLNAGSELDVCDKNNMAQSESNDQVGMVNHLTDMETGLIIPNKMNSWAPLFLASWYGHLDIVKVLTVKGAQLDVCEKTSGRSALHIAAEKNHISVAEHLIEKGADINICGQLGGLTPLHVASQRGNVEMVMLLIEKGAHMEIQDRINGQTPLHNAAWCCHFELAKCLINKGANINATDDCGWTPMHIAAEKNHLDMVQLLVEYGANINTRTNTYDWTPLHYAAKYGRSDIVEFLIKNKAELEVHDAMRGQIALHIAAENSHLHVIKQLVEGGTSVQVRDSNGMTALDIALAQNDKLMVEYLKPLTDPIIPRT